nr:alpha/beta fold hydrolase [Roseobacter sp. GAI101]
MEDGPTHLVGHSYGAVIATWIATRHPQRVKSLALFEPPVFIVAPDDAEVVAMASVNRDLAENPPADPGTMIRGFFTHVGIRPPADMPPEAQKGLARELATMRSPTEADITLNQLRTGGWPIRVMTSGKTPGSEGIARAIAALPRAEHIIVPHVDHNTQKNGAVVNPVLEDLWNTVE